MNQIYFGDNLQVLREHLQDESVDLIQLDPPLNFKHDYNLLFKSPKTVGRVPSPGAASGDAAYSSAQITALEDSWQWGEQAEREFDELTPNTAVSKIINSPTN